MPNTEIELNPVDFITVGTIGPKGKRQFHLQAGKDAQIITLTIEKQQAYQLAEAIRDMMGELEKQEAIDAQNVVINLSEWDMELRDPVEPQFRVAKMGLGYDQDRDMIILVTQELLIPDEDAEAMGLAGMEEQPSVVRFWGTREQYLALAEHALGVVEQGRADPRQNGHVIYYWT